MVKADLVTRIYNIISQRKVYHLLFWAVFLLVLLTVRGASHGFALVFFNQVITLSFYAILVYFNLFYLIPNYLTNSKLFTYLGLLILAVLIITPIKIIALYFFWSGIPEAQFALLNSKSITFLSTFLVVSLSTVLKIITDWGRNLREKQELQTQTMQSELRFLKSQINPHFLFNTLNNLYALTLKKSDEAPEIVIKLSEMMRYMLYECNEKQVLLSKEVAYIQNYLDLERLRQGKNTTITFKVEGEIEDRMVAPLLFTPFLENSFKHGLGNAINKGFVNILLKTTADKVHFSIENSKPSTAPVQIHNKKSGGIGLVNIKRRLELLYPRQHYLEIKESPNTYKVILEVQN